MRVAVRARRDHATSEWDVEITVGNDVVERRRMVAVDGEPFVAGPGQQVDPDLAIRAARVRCCEAALEDQTALGVHLFDVLIGTSAWTRIRELSDLESDHFVELALTWDADELILTGVRWELLHDRDSFLAASPPPRAVAISRVVADACAPAPPTVQAPARVLFVIGADLADPTVRAGAEVIGLLRRMERGKGVIKGSVLERASRARLAEAIRRFTPDIVHFVTHGRVDPAAGAQILLRDDENADVQRYVDADGLIDALRDDDGKLPAMAVITACESGTALGPAPGSDHTAPLAVALVSHGIPIVVGMTGRVSDRACRLFVHRFGEALADSGQLTKAVTHGRRAALFEDGSFTDRGDWALPALFLAPDVPADHVPVDAAAVPGVLARIAAYELQRDPIFCGRRSFFAALDRLLDRGPDSPLEVLGAYVESSTPGVGKTRLLDEMAECAIRDGHIIVLANERSQQTRTNRPKSPWHVAAVLAQAIADTRLHFGLDVSDGCLLIAELADAAGVSHPLEDVERRQRRRVLTKFLHEHEASPPAVDSDLVAEAARLEMVQLIEDGRRAGLPGIDDDSRVLVILEDVERWHLPTVKQALGAYGMGLPEEPVPVVFTCTMGGEHADLLKQMQRESAGQLWSSYEPLSAFRTPEDTLAYQWVLLNPRPKEVGDWLTPDALLVYTVAPGASEQDWAPRMKAYMKGVPGKFDDDTFYAIAAVLGDQGVLQVGNDEDVLRKYEDEHL